MLVSCHVMVTQDIRLRVVYERLYECCVRPASVAGAVGGDGGSGAGGDGGGVWLCMVKDREQKLRCRRE